MTTKEIRHQLNQAATIVKATLKKLPDTADGMAIALYNHGIRRAKCRDNRKCALAQHLAKTINMKNIHVSVDGGGVTLFYGTKTSDEYLALKVRVPVTKINKAVDKFIHKFDEGDYNFLTRTK